ncbi:hypothetical protein SAMN04488120_11123 [Fontimonas thermophila]|uniref:Uncharacterized protein n=1 Tax=Fontimonas thermophila TaxID=1076937 RepID=A0A1I2JZD1_9GAMM|nr:hypothetical protein [Fontimonas thermophila]SFF59529.1 hypothetical protein SAMN04488120_11123 [Fontimonas thermophila]
MDSPRVDQDRQRRRRNLVLFVLHLALAAAILGWFVWSVVHRP